MLQIIVQICGPWNVLCMCFVSNGGFFIGKNRIYKDYGNGRWNQTTMVKKRCNSKIAYNQYFSLVVAIRSKINDNDYTMRH